MKTLFSFILILGGIFVVNSNATPPYHVNQQVIKKDVVVVKEKIVEFDADTYLGTNGYYAVVEELADKHNVDKQIQKKDEQIDALIRLLEAKYKNGEAKPTVPTELPSPPPSEPVPVPNNDSLDSQVFQIFKANCIDCHGPNQSKGKLKLIDRDDKGNFLVDNSKRAHNIYDRVKGTRLKERGLQLMPIGGATLSDNDVETIHVWMIRELNKVLK